MNSHADKFQENKSQSVANKVFQKKSTGLSIFQFIDNRPEAVAQIKLQEIANNSPKAKQAAQLQAMADRYSAQHEQTIPKKKNNTGLPDNLKTGIENLSGYSMDDVKVHFNSNIPAQLKAHAYTQGTDIHLGSGQEKHLPHEAWHVVQQKQGRVKPTIQMKNQVNINDDTGLEKEADYMGVRALQMKSSKNTQLNYRSSFNPVIQPKVDGSFSELMKTLESYKGCPKNKSWTVFLNKIWGLLKKSPVNYAIDDLARNIFNYSFEKEKITKWVERGFVKEQREFLDEDILAGNDPHGGRKHLSLTKKEQEKRLHDEDKTIGTSMQMNHEILEFMSYLDENLKKDLAEIIIDPALSGLNSLREGRNHGQVKQSLKTYNKTKDFTHYSIEITFNTDSWHQGNATFNLKAVPTLKSNQQFDIKQYLRTKKSHWKTKQVSEKVEEGETRQKILSMFWGRTPILVPVSIADSEADVNTNIKANVHGGVTLF